MKYELINPSDEIFFDAPSFKVAALTCIYLSNGAYGAKATEDGGEDVPVMIFGWSKWWTERFGTLPEQEMTEHASEVAAALKTFRIEEGERTSLNDICGRAAESADSLEKTVQKVKALDAQRNPKKANK